MMYNLSFGVHNEIVLGPSHLHLFSAFPQLLFHSSKPGSMAVKETAWTTEQRLLCPLTEFGLPSL